MQDRSPSGSLCPYYYMGGELHPLKYGSCHKDKAKLLALIAAEEAFILKSSGRNNRRIWIDLYQTALDSQAINALVAHIANIGEKICKICLVSCPLLARWKIKRRLRVLDADIAKQLRFFSDPEDGKKWLVGKRG